MERISDSNNLSGADTSEAPSSQEVRAISEVSPAIRDDDAAVTPGETIHNQSSYHTRLDTDEVLMPQPDSSSEHVSPSTRLPGLELQGSENDMWADSDSSSEQLQTNQRSNTRRLVNRSRVKSTSSQENKRSETTTSQSNLSVLPRVDSMLIKSMIWDHMIHNCYEKSAQELILDERFFLDLKGYQQRCSVSGLSSKTTQKRHGARDGEKLNGDAFYAENNFMLAVRKNILEHVLAGRILDAIKLSNQILTSVSPSKAISETHPELYVDLLCQQFVELVRAGNEYEALSFARVTIIPFRTHYDSIDSKLENYIPLLAYPHPEHSPHSKLLDLDVRESLADRLNGAVLCDQRGRSGALAGKSALEKFLRKVAFAVGKVKHHISSFDQLLENLEYC